MGTPCVVADEVPSVHDLGAAGDPPARIVDPLDVDDIAAGLDAVPDRRRRCAPTWRRAAPTTRSARTWHAVARQHIDAVAGAAVTGPRSPSRSTSPRCPNVRAAPATTPWRSPAAWLAATDVDAHAGGAPR